MRCLHCGFEGVDSATVLCPKCKVHLPSLTRDLLPPGAELHGGKYRVDYALGQGGFGITYLARHASLKKPVAIKEFYPQEQVVREATTGQIVLKSSGEDAYRRALRRFMREGETLAALDHSGVVRVNDQFEENGTAYLVMDLIEGRTLKDELDAHPGRRLPESRVREFTEQLVSALEAVHARGVYHLDIKPDNVLIRPDGRAVLVDFGASKQGLGTKSTLSFTLEYAAPEVLSGEGTVGPQSDLFELGMVVHEMLTGHRPPTALTRLTGTGWQPDKIDEPWRTLLASALRLNRDERPSSVRAWWEARVSSTPPRPYPLVTSEQRPVIPEQTHSTPSHADPPSQIAHQDSSHPALPPPTSPRAKHNVAHPQAAQLGASQPKVVVSDRRLIGVIVLVVVVAVIILAAVRSSDRGRPMTSMPQNSNASTNGRGNLNGSYYGNVGRANTAPVNMSSSYGSGNAAANRAPYYNVPSGNVSRVSPSR